MASAYPNLYASKRTCYTQARSAFTDVHTYIEVFWNTLEGMEPKKGAFFYETVFFAASIHCLRQIFSFSLYLCRRAYAGTAGVYDEEKFTPLTEKRYEERRSKRVRHILLQVFGSPPFFLLCSFCCRSKYV